MAIAFRLWAVALVLSAGVRIARADESYYGASIDDLASVTIVGIDDGTDWELVDLDGARVAASGAVGRLETAAVELGTLRHFGLHTSAPVVAYLGRDCCAVGGTTFLPTAQGHARAGRVFVADFPVLPADALRLFAIEDADVTVQERSGAIAVSRHVNAGDAWIAWGLRGAAPYLLRATGDVVLQLNVANGDESVPPLGRLESCDQDVADSFVLATNPWATGSIAVFAYDDADVQITRVGELLPVVELAMSAGTVEYVDHMGLDEWFVRATGRVAVWTGDTEGGDGISFMGDDVTQNLGDRGRDVLVHTQTHGATVFAATDGTEVDVAGQESVTLDRDGFLDLAPEQLVRVTASAPILVQTSGGNDMNDWGTFLRPVPAPEATDCPDREDIVLEVPADAGVPPPDAGLDAAAPDAAPPGEDAASSEPDAATRPALHAHGGGCSCHAAPVADGSWLALLLALPLLHRGHAPGA